MKPESEVRKHSKRISQLLGNDCVNLFVNIYRYSFLKNHLSMEDSLGILAVGFPLISELRRIYPGLSAQDVASYIWEGRIKAEDLRRTIVSWSNEFYPGYYKEYLLAKIEFKRSLHHIKLLLNKSIE